MERIEKHQLTIIERIKALRKRINKIWDGLYSRNEPLSNLVLLSEHFNDLEWLSKENRDKKHQIIEIMKVLECSRRSAYDYLNTFEALRLCDKLSDELIEFLKYENYKRQLTNHKS